ncbi:malto-oligosyltrehalose synthase [Microbacterium aureliae]
MPDRPVSTYRLQIRESFDLDAARDLVPYLRDLGVDWAYLSPLLTASTGSDHGYDVVDVARVDPARGGPEALARFAAEARAAGLGILVDIVPNHMGVAVPRQNPWWWDVLTHGRDSRYAEAFDIDWDVAGGRVRIPILGAPPAEALADVRVDAGAGVVRYFDHELPLAPRSLEGVDPEDVAAVLARQNWELLFWRDEAELLNYRRFFAVTTLAGVRVEVPWVFDETHREILRWIGDGHVDGLRVDHPDGLADPGAYLRRLAEATGGAYVLVEKILEHSATDHPEQLPAWWSTDGTTGYDAMAEIDRVLIDPRGEAALDRLDEELRGAASPSWPDLIHETKRMIADTIQVAEIRRLVRRLPAPVAGAEDALAEILACYPVYRSYLPAGQAYLDEALGEARRRRPDLARAIGELEPMLRDPSLEIARRFQQTTGPVMAKGVEDTAFYRATRLGTLTEVGGDPSVFALDVEGLHAAFARRQAAWPHALTSLSTHDTKRGEDVRARLSVLSEIPEEWGAVLRELRSIASTGHGPFDSLLWQAIVGSWPADAGRLHAYAEKAAREAAERTGWWDPDEDFERGMHALVDSAFGPARPVIERFVARIAPLGWSNSLTAKLLQLAGPGVPDVYQGSELWETSLVDPDNRRRVDFAERRALLARLDGGWRPAVDATGAAKLLVTSRTLRLRRERPDAFALYRPMVVAGAAAGHAVAFDRGGVVAVGTRLPAGLAERGGWGDTVLLRPDTRAVDVLTGRTVTGAIALEELLADYPVALLVAEDEGER